ncbi:MAG: stage II sporulation protein R [Clostridia bacterium]|nr:stage II sporulation protein R [Clostridia bacterium]
MKLKAIEISALIAFLFTVISTLSFENSCEGIREKVLRLHVIAASDSVADQSMKYAVRDELLRDGESIFCGSETVIQAQERIGDSLAVLQKSAERTLRSQGCDYPVSVILGRAYFPTREYGDITLPAGYYNAVRVVIGQGKGKNWWCVMFPPMCLPAATKENVTLEEILSEKETDIVSGGQKYEIRFWFVEKYYELREKFID